MKNRFGIGLALSALAVVAHAQDERPDVRKQAESFIRAMDKAINTRNSTAFFTMFSPDYYTVDTQGRRTSYLAFKSNTQESMKAMREVKSTTTVKNVQLQNSEIVVWTEQQLKFLANIDGKWQPLVSTSRWAETLKRDGDSFKFTSSQQLMLNEPWSFKTNN
jgi:hypothetical protein